MNDITLVSKEYTESVFVDGPKFDKLSAFVSGPDAQVQGKLTASTGINLNNNTISVNTASSVGTSTLPVTASAVNTKLSNYVNSVSSPDGSITVNKTGSTVTLKANGSGGNYDYITENHIDKSLTLQTGDGLYFCVDEHSTFTNGPIALTGGWGPGTIISDATNNYAVGNMGGFVIRHLAGEGQQFKIGVAADMTWTDAVLELESYDSSGNSTGFCQLDGDKLNKLSSLINKADELLALLNN